VMTTGPPYVKPSVYSPVRPVRMLTMVNAMPAGAAINNLCLKSCRKHTF
jgi:hypothetical protein